MLRKLQPVCQVKLEELRSKIRKGLKSGPSEPWDAATLKKKARARQAAESSVASLESRLPHSKIPRSRSG